jgi:hypothetical protein
LPVQRGGALPEEVLVILLQWRPFQRSPDLQAQRPPVRTMPPKQETDRLCNVFGHGGWRTLSASLLESLPPGE